MSSKLKTFLGFFKRKLSTNLDKKDKPKAPEGVVVLHEEVVTNGTKPLGIFWDLDNCPIPVHKSVSLVVKQIREFIAKTHPNTGFAKHFFCAADVLKLDPTLAEGLDRNGVVVVHVNASAKNAADDRLQDLMDTFVDTFGHNCRAVLVVISGDINFAKSIRNARHNGCEVMLIHGINCSEDLKNSVNESYLFSDVIKTVDNISNDTTNRLNKAYIKVSELPEDIPNELIVRQLSKLSSNCGGKPEFVSNGKALIRFGCKDDAQRCLQRLAGEECFGQKIDSKLMPLTVENSKWPSIATPVVKTYASATASVSGTQDIQDFPHNSMINRMSFIRGLTTKVDEDVTRVVRQLVHSWKDTTINGNFVSYVERHRGYKVKDGKVPLFVTASSPQTSLSLISSAQKYLKPSDGIVWTQYTDLKSNNKSVIRGLSTESDENIAKTVRKLVMQWNDRSIHGNFIVCVEQYVTRAQDGERVDFIVTATSAETNKALVRGAKKYLSPNSGIVWTYYSGQDYNSVSADHKSVINGLAFDLGENVTQLVRNMVNQWFDAEVNGSLIHSVEKHENLSLIVTAVSREANNKLVKTAKKFYVSGFSWTQFKDPIDPIGQTSQNSLITDNLERKSFIRGLDTKATETVAKTVRKLVMNWNDRSLNGNLIVDVKRDPKRAQEDGKVDLTVIATNAQISRALVSGAQKYLNPNDDIVWTQFNAVASTEDTTHVIGQELQTISSHSMANTDHTIVNNCLETRSDDTLSSEQSTTLSFGTQSVNSCESITSGFTSLDIQELSHSDVSDDQISDVGHKVNEDWTKVVHKTRTRSRGAKKVKNGLNLVGDRRKSFIRGLDIESDENIAKTVRKLVMKWNDRSINGNFIAGVEREPIREGTGGNVQLIVTATNAQTCRALVSGAQQYLNPNDGIVWTEYTNKSKPLTQKFTHNSVSDDHKSVLIGLDTNPDEDVTKTVQNMITNWNDKKIKSTFIANVVWVSARSQKTQLLVIATSAQACRALVIGAQKHLNANNDSIKWIFFNSKYVRYCLFVITGLNTKHTDDVLLLVRQLIIGFSDSRLCAEDIISVTRDSKLQSRDGKALLYVRVTDVHKKELILDLAHSLANTSKVQFNDYNR